MHVKFSSRVFGKALYSSTFYPKGSIVKRLRGELFLKPTRETIEINPESHILDDLGKFVNHSNRPTCKILDGNIVADTNIVPGDEITFDYNESETSMASPFIDDTGAVVGGRRPARNTLRDADFESSTK